MYTPSIGTIDGKDPDIASFPEVAKIENYMHERQQPHGSRGDEAHFKIRSRATRAH
jgi:hypothetical protein